MADSHLSVNLFTFCYDYTRTMALAAIRTAVKDEELTDAEVRDQIKGIFKVLEENADFYANNSEEKTGVGS